MSAEPAAQSETYASINEKISALVLRRRTRLGWFVAAGIAFGLTLAFFSTIGYLLLVGTGIWGINIPVAWGFAITSFVWWIGIGHAGTLISAILLLLRQEWRTSVSRFAESMTLFAVACAGIFPLIHLGRPWYFYWMLPYPNNQDLLPQFRSALVWDMFAILAYAAVSFLFWYIGLLPDLAALRDRARNRFTQVAFGVLAMGWRGSARHWHRHQQIYFWLAALAAPLVISVHSIVGLDTAITIVPGWHSTLSPPYFVFGALLSGIAMVMTIAIPLRAVFHLEAFITDRHLNNLSKFLIGTSLLVAYSYLMELFMGWYGGSPFEEILIRNRFLGAYAPLYWSMLAINAVLPHALWFRRIRENRLILFVIVLVVNVGMWLERFIIVVGSLHRGYLPSSWELFVPTVWDLLTLLGSIGLFVTLLLLFIRFLPVISIFELEKQAAGE